MSCAREQMGWQRLAKPPKVYSVLPPPSSSPPAKVGRSTSVATVYGGYLLRLYTVYRQFLRSALLPGPVAGSALQHRRVRHQQRLHGCHLAGLLPPVPAPARLPSRAIAPNIVFLARAVALSPFFRLRQVIFTRPAWMYETSSRT